METLLEVGRNYDPTKRKVYSVIIGVLLLFIILTIVIFTFSTSGKADVLGRPACLGHDHCPSSKACIQGNCRDPCERLCGYNTSCTVFHHFPACACKERHTGNPFIGCAYPQEIKGVWPPSSGKKNFYLENSIQVDWQEAFMLCLRNNSRLASIDNKDEFEVVLQLIDRHGHRNEEYWTSGSDRGSEGNFIWASTGRHLTSTSDMWVKGEPNNYNNHDHCVDFWEEHHAGYGLNDADCHKSHYFVCEYYV